MWNEDISSTNNSTTGGYCLIDFNKFSNGNLLWIPRFSKYKHPFYIMNTLNYYGQDS